MSKRDASLRSATLRVWHGKPTTRWEGAAGTALLLVLSTALVAVVTIMAALLTQWVTGGPQ